MPQDLLPLVVSQGDPAGIGPDLILTAFARRTELALSPFAVAGDPAVLSERAGRLGLAVTVVETDISEAAGHFVTALPVIPVRCPAAVTPGTPDSANAPAIIEAIRLGVDLTLSGKAAGLVTAPIAKSVLYASGFGFPGHTEYLGALASEATGHPVTPVMMIAGPLLRVVPVTIHIPLKDVAESLTSADIVTTGRILAGDLSRRFALARPRIAVSGLNPHAGENGTLGKEDEAIIVPAIETLRASGIEAFGPLPADTMFHEEARAGYDAALCMYHDQALIPAKALGFHDSVNVTLGLPFIRTSPDHGTAFSLAGTGKADCGSFIAALQMAARMAANAAQLKADAA